MLILATILLLFFPGSKCEQGLTCEENNEEISKFQSKSQENQAPLKKEVETCIDDYFALKDTFAGIHCVEKYTEVMIMDRVSNWTPRKCTHIPKNVTVQNSTIELPQNSGSKWCDSDDKEYCKLVKGCDIENDEFSLAYYFYKKSGEMSNLCEEKQPNALYKLLTNSDYSCKKELQEYARQKMAIEKFLKNRKRCSALTDYKRRLNAQSACEVANQELAIQKNQLPKILSTMFEKLQQCVQAYRDTDGTSGGCQEIVAKIVGYERLKKQLPANCSQVEPENWNSTSYLRCVRQRTEDILEDRPIFLGELCEKLNPYLYVPKEPSCAERNGELTKAKTVANETIEYFRKMVKDCYLVAEDNSWKCPKLQLVVDGLQMTIDKNLETC